MTFIKVSDKNSLHKKAQKTYDVPSNCEGSLIIYSNILKVLSTQTTCIANQVAWIHKKKRFKSIRCIVLRSDDARLKELKLFLRELNVRHDEVRSKTETSLDFPRM